MWEGLILSARLQEMAIDGLLNRYLLLALQHSHLYYDSLEKAKAVSSKWSLAVNCAHPCRPVGGMLKSLVHNYRNQHHHHRYHGINMLT